MQAPTPALSTSVAPHGGLLAELRSLVSEGDYGRSYRLHDVYRLLVSSIDRYVDGGFNWTFAVESQAPPLVFRGACNDIAGFRGLPKLPADVTHLKGLLKTNSILDYIQEGVRQEWAPDAQRQCPPDQYATSLPGHYSKLKFKTEEACVLPPEFWLQAGNRESPIHVDHGRLISYIPPCARSCFKIWVFFPPNIKPSFKWANKEDPFNHMLDTSGAAVLVQRPGDVVYLNSLVYHSVLLGFQPETPDRKKWGAFGDVVVLTEDRPQSFKNTTQLASGSDRGSQRAWIALLSAFCVMDGRVWKGENIEAEKKNIPEQAAQERDYDSGPLACHYKMGHKEEHAGEDENVEREEEGKICQHN